MVVRLHVAAEPVEIGIVVCVLHVSEFMDHDHPQERRRRIFENSGDPNLAALVHARAVDSLGCKV